MRILVSGSTGLLGSLLVERARARGDEVVPLVRRDGEAGVRWDPANGRIEGDVSGFDAVVHLAGENIAGRRWNEAFKARVKDSRVDGTRLLAQALADCAQPPKVLVCASATGIYGNRGDEVLDESSEPGEGFLAEVGRAWEAAADPARAAGIRVVHVRVGIVLSREGGALAKMLTPFKLGLGGRIGPGTQYWSWITRADVVRAFLFAVDREDLRGPVNAVAPGPVTNAEFTKVLGRALGRPTVLPLPAFAARLMMGREMADELLLASVRARPAVLEAAGFEFETPELVPDAM